MNGKSSLNKLKTNYFKIPFQIVNSGLTVVEFAVYIFMASCAEEFDPSVRVIAKKLKLSTGTITRGIKGLLNKNIIQCIDQGELGKRSRYKFLPPSVWELY
jgi:predicted transcriptional regulator